MDLSEKVVEQLASLASRRNRRVREQHEARCGKPTHRTCSANERMSESVRAILRGEGYGRVSSNLFNRRVSQICRALSRRRLSNLERALRKKKLDQKPIQLKLL
jgi:hypothetical protein